MKTLNFFLTFILLAVATPCGVQAGSSFTGREMAGNPTDSSITLNFIPAVSMEIYYEYGTSSGIYDSRSQVQSAAGGEPITTLIDGLQPDTRYYYRLHDNGAAGQEHTFVTQRASGSTFSFGVQADSHIELPAAQFDTQLYRKTLLSAAAQNPDFYLSLGDDFVTTAMRSVTQENVYNLYLEQRAYLSLVDAPVFLVNGNHEHASPAFLDGSAENVAVWAQNARNSLFTQPAPDDFYSGDEQPVEHIGLLRDYYAFTWGDALFVVLDPYWHSDISLVTSQRGSQAAARNLWDVTLGEKQYSWFKETLENSTARYKFVFAHHVNGTGRGGVEVAGSYEWGDADSYAEQRPGWQETVHRLMVENDVTIFFQGHDHIFARQELDGVVYQTLPKPADPAHEYENAAFYRSGDLLPNGGYLNVTVSPENVTVDYMRTWLEQEDEVAFSYTVPAAE